MSGKSLLHLSSLLRPLPALSASTYRVAAFENVSIRPKVEGTSKEKEALFIFRSPPLIFLLTILQLGIRPLTECNACPLDLSPSLSLQLLSLCFSFTMCNNGCFNHVARLHLQSRTPQEAQRMCPHVRPERKVDRHRLCSLCPCR